MGAIHPTRGIVWQWQIDAEVKEGAQCGLISFHASLWLLRVANDQYLVHGSQSSNLQCTWEDLSCPADLNLLSKRLAVCGS